MNNNGQTNESKELNEKLGNALDSGMNCVIISGHIWIYTIRDGWHMAGK